MKNTVRIVILLFLCIAVALYFFPDAFPEKFQPASVFITETVRRVIDWINPEPAPPANSYEVIRAVDGDTILVRIDGEEVFVRLIGIDAPESVHQDFTKNTPEGRIASLRMKEYVTDKQASLAFDQELQDRYGRTLAYVYVDGELLEDRMLREGLAITLVMEPNIRYQLHFEEIEKTAREQGVGFWGTGFFTEVSSAHKE